MTQPTIAAKLVILFKPEPEGNWIEMDVVELTLPAIRIGRSQSCEVVIPYARQGERSCVSRFHGSMFKWEDTAEYEVMDGIYKNVSIATPDTEVSSSSSRLLVNERRLEVGERILLKDKDEITLVPNQVKLIYLHKKSELIEKLEDLTYVPEEQ